MPKNRDNATSFWPSHNQLVNNQRQPWRWTKAWAKNWDYGEPQIVTGEKFRFITRIPRSPTHET